MDRTQFYGQKFNMIQVLRGIAVIFVLLEHIELCGFGAFGVDIFFVISGFMAMYSTSDKSKQKGFSFLIKRFFRISPLYYVMTLIVAVATLLAPQVFEQTEFSVWYILKAFLYIPYTINGDATPILRVGWCLNYEMLFYLVFFIAMKISHKYRGLITSAVFLALTVIGGFVDFESVILRFWFGELCAEFVLGILAFYICYAAYPFFRSVKERKFLKGLLSVSVVLTSILLFIMMAKKITVFSASGFLRPLNWGVSSFVIFIIVFWLGCIIDVPDTVVKPGNISFSLFLVHYPIIMAVNRIGENFDNIGTRILITILGVVISVVISIPAYYLFERKLYGIFKKT